MCVSQVGVSTMVHVTTLVILVRHGPKPVQSAEAWVLTCPLSKVRRKMSIFNTDTMATRPGSVWMTLLQRDCSLGWMGVQISSVTGRRVNLMTFRGRTAYTLLVPVMDTFGMTWIARLATNIHVKKVGRCDYHVHVLAAYFPSLVARKLSTPILFLCLLYATITLMVLTF